MGSIDDYTRKTDLTSFNGTYAISDGLTRRIAILPPKTKKEIQQERAAKLLTQSHIVYNKTVPKCNWYQRYWRPPESIN